MTDPRLDPNRDEDQTTHERRDNVVFKAKPTDLLDDRSFPRWLRLAAAISVILVSIYPAYLGIATLMEKREESRRESEIRLRQMVDEEAARREQIAREDKEHRDQELELA